MPDFPSLVANVWSAATRTLTGFTGQPRTDLMGEDASFESGVGIRKVRIDNSLAAVPVIEASIAMTGVEVTLFEILDTLTSMVEAWVDMTPMQAGDTIVFKYYKKMKAGGAYSLYANDSYSGAQALPALNILRKGIYRDTKVTATQTAGVNRTLDVQVTRTASKTN